MAFDLEGLRIRVLRGIAFTARLALPDATLMLASPDTMDRRVHIPPFLLILFGWTVFGLFMTTQSYVVRLQAGHPVPWGTLALVEIPYAWLWALLTPVVVLLARRFPLSGRFWNVHVAVHIGAGLLLAVVHDLLVGFLRAAVLPSSAPVTPGTQLRNVIAFFDYGVILYWVILLTVSAFAYVAKVRESEIRALQLEGQLAQAALESLRMRIHPHFLFNTLNAISVLIGKDPDAARKTIGTLSTLLRYSLETSGEVPLRKELDVLGSYLNIEQTRFGDRLTVAMHIEPSTLDIMVPHFLLQPLVENAIKHGISRIQGPAHIAVSAFRENGTIHLEVRDNGIGLGDKREIRDGIGLQHTRARLAQLYGDRYRFAVTNGEERGVVVSVSLPAVREAA
jgi:two-component system, LytTR family, sensor kinase